MDMRLKCADGPLSGHFATIDPARDEYVLIPEANGTFIQYRRYVVRKCEGGGKELMFAPIKDA